MLEGPTPQQDEERDSSLAMDPSPSYVPNNPQFGVQLECNWSATLPALQTTTAASAASVANTAAASIASVCASNELISSAASLVPPDELAACWSEDMGSFTLPLDLEPLPSLFPFSPCSGNSNSYKQDLGNFNHNHPHHAHNQQVFALRGETKQPAEVADVLLSLKHAVVHPGQETHQGASAKCENQHLYHHHHHHHHHPQVLLSPGGYASGLCGDQNFNPQPTMFPAMSVNVSMNMTMHGYHPSNYPSSELAYPQVQWNPTAQSSTPLSNVNYQTGLLSPGYTGATYSFTADFRPPPTQNDASPTFKPFSPSSQTQIASLSNPQQTRRKQAGTYYDNSTLGECGGGVPADAAAKPNVCRICGKSYARPSTLKTHLRTHSGEKPYRCADCNKSFSQAANLTAHVRTHSGEKPFRCPVCDRRFSQSSSVTTHMRTHSGERPYRCRLCRKAFSDSSTLTKHLRIHSGEKPYECKLCLLRFSQSGNLNRHMRVHGNNNGLMPP